MTVVIVKPGYAPYEADINGLDEMQKVVGGIIQAIYPFEDNAAVVCNDEGLFLDLPFNRSVPGGYGGVFGNFFVCGLGEEDFCSLTPEQVKAYKKEFHSAEILIGAKGNTPITLKVQPKAAGGSGREKGRDTPPGREYSTMQEQLSASERLKALTDQLEQGVSDIFQSGQYAAYLTAMSKFHHYSFGNAMLIFMQCPNASHVAGYHDWKRKFGRQVKRGEHGITILAPCPYRRREEVEETAPDGSTATTIQLVQRVGFRTVTVFDVSQTEGKPLPELVHKLTGGVVDYERITEAISHLSPYPISIEAFPGAAFGCCNFAEQRILVQPDMSQVQTIKTMIHEVSHAKLHAPKEGAAPEENRSEQRSSREVEAESVAYVVCQHFGIDTSDYSFGYVAGWSRGKDLSQLKTSLERIRDTAAELIDSIDPPKELSQPVQEKPAQKRRNARGKRNQPDRLSR